MLGTVEVGFPASAEEALLDTLSLEEYLIRNKEATYLLRVQGDSMVDAGILPGDSVLVERREDAKDLDIVIAEVDGEWTMKVFRKHGRRDYDDLRRVAAVQYPRQMSHRICSRGSTATHARYVLTNPSSHERNLIVASTQWQRAGWPTVASGPLLTCTDSSVHWVKKSRTRWYVPLGGDY
ncbi:MAG: hypothetical protein H0W49_09055 [Nitrospirales bacterium]|nr:hypothetical protein [Nitrospirales bacterium]